MPASPPNPGQLTIDAIAASLYHSYSDAVGGRAYNGDPLPTWPQFAADPAKRLQAQAWRVVAHHAIRLGSAYAINSARAVVDACLGEIPQPHDASHPG